MPLDPLGVGRRVLRELPDPFSTHALRARVSGVRHQAVLTALLDEHLVKLEVIDGVTVYRKVQAVAVRPVPKRTTTHLASETAPLKTACGERQRDVTMAIGSTPSCPRCAGEKLTRAMQSESA